MNIRYTLEKETGWLIFSDPPGNPMSLDFFDELGQRINEILSFPLPKALIITGSHRHFSSGARIDELLQKATPGHFIRHSAIIAALMKINIPVLAAIRGVCVGSALELAMHCHYRICTREAVFALPESTFSLMPGLGGISRMMQLAGKSIAMELILTGRTFSADEALQSGIVDAVVPKENFRDFVLHLTSNLPGGDPGPYRKIMKFKYINPFLTDEQIPAFG